MKAGPVAFRALMAIRGGDKSNYRDMISAQEKPRRGAKSKWQHTHNWKYQKTRPLRVCQVCGEAERIEP